MRWQSQCNLAHTEEAHNQQVENEQTKSIDNSLIPFRAETRSTSMLDVYSLTYLQNKYEVLIAGAQVQFFLALFACFALFLFLHFLSYSWRGAGEFFYFCTFYIFCILSFF